MVKVTITHEDGTVVEIKDVVAYTTWTKEFVVDIANNISEDVLTEEQENEVCEHLENMLIDEDNPTSESLVRDIEDILAYMEEAQ